MRALLAMADEAQAAKLAERAKPKAEAMPEGHEGDEEAKSDEVDLDELAASLGEG
jgi:hypothetical protein